MSKKSKHSKPIQLKLLNPKNRKIRRVLNQRVIMILWTRKIKAEIQAIVMKIPTLTSTQEDLTIL